MELKFSMSCEDGYEVTMFKLYLYGIEIAEWGRYCPAGEFKLYLYGIEIRKIRETHVKQIHVQIVPLWNWNLVPDVLARPDYLFKLYLYGIEIQSPCSLEISSAVHIVPLWNWNILPHFVFLRGGGKLYLYGIEILLSLVAIGVQLVQIVPLWNWNGTITRK